MTDDPYKNLTARQAAFVREYLVDFYGKGAAVRAGYSEATASVQASRLLALDKIKALVKVGKEEKNKAIKLTSEEVLENLRRLAKKAEEAEKFNDAIRAQELLGRHVAMFTDRIETPGAPDAITINFLRDEEKPAEKKKVISLPKKATACIDVSEIKIGRGI